MLKFALAGNPNSGKTTLFNALTGSTAHVGNWPGVTVDKREGTYKKGENPVDIVDLPGIYSLSPYTPEEVIARNFILEERPDCIINIVDATNLERNLYLTTQLMEVDTPMIIALNMADVLEKNGDHIDVKALEKNVGLPVVEISALKGRNIDLLMERAVEAVEQKRVGVSVLKDSVLGSAIANAEIALKLKDVPAPLFHAVKLVEKDEIEVKNHPAEARAVESFIKENVCQRSGFCGDAEAEIADARYKYITAHYSSTLTRARKAAGETSKTEKADKILTNRFAGIPIFLVILFLIFHLTFSEDMFFLGAIVKPFGEWCGVEGNAAKSIFFAGGLNSPGVILFNALDLLTSKIGEWLTLGLNGLGASSWVSGLVVDGIWGGVASVLSFLPQILVLFLFFSILEDSGYMARVAFMLDRIFRRFGVSGRAFMPMIMGFGCSVPAMINTRTMADEREREATVRVIPFFSCGAKLPILLAIAGGIVATTGVAGGYADVITYSMYLLGIVTALVCLLIMRNTTKRGEASPFIMELPTYHLPGFKNLMLHLWDKAKHFIQKAFTIILVSCVVVWFLSNFGWNWKMVDGMDQSILASIGQFLQPIFTPLGFGAQLNQNGWVFAVAALTGLIAKEDVIATFGTLAACLVASMPSGEYGEGVAEVMVMIEQTGITVPALISFIAFNMLTIPCFAAVAAAKGETAKGKFKWTLLFWIVVSFVTSAIVYSFGTMFNHPIANGNVWSIFVSIGIVILAALAILSIVLYNKHMNKKEAKAKLLKNK